VLRAPYTTVIFSDKLNRTVHILEFNVKNIYGTFAADYQLWDKDEHHIPYGTELVCIRFGASEKQGFCLVVREVEGSDETFVRLDV